MIYDLATLAAMCAEDDKPDPETRLYRSLKASGTT